MRALSILLVEDNPGDVRLIREAFKEVRIEADIEVAEDGEAALARLTHLPEALELPDMIILDLNLPKMDGHQVLLELKMDVHLRRIPIVVLSSSRDPKDIVASYNNYANCYIPKPLAFEDYLSVAKGIQEFWLRVVSLPNRTRWAPAAG